MRQRRIRLPPLPPGRPNLVLTGFMGTGKTTVGRLVAQSLKMPFFDLDDELEARTGRSISALLGEDGEDRFRELERVVLEFASRLSGAVISTGGGAVLSAEAFARLGSNSVVVVLWASPQEVRSRLATAQPRPMLTGDLAIPVERLLDNRRFAYGQAGRGIETTGRSPLEVAEEVSGHYQEEAGVGPAVFEMVRPMGTTKVVIGLGAAADLGTQIRLRLASARRAFVIADAGASAALAALTRSLEAAGLRVVVSVSPGGEVAKSLESVTSMWRFLLENEADRQDVVVALGGGALLDSAGFAAATFARGLPLVNVPTTILAMGDASLGGKVAINLGGVKNPVGAFHHPELVVADPLLIGDVAAPLARSGLAEIVKAAVIGSPLCLRYLLRDEVDPSVPDQLNWLVEQSLRVKAAHVAADPTDRSERLALNLGHTFAHGLESASDFRIPHGEAVGLGLLAAARLGAQVGVSPLNLEEDIRSALLQLGLPTSLPVAVDRSRVETAMRRDKKRRSGRAVFVVAGTDLGAVLLEEFDLAVALAALWETAGGVLGKAGTTQPAALQQWSRS
ncbi:MAG TPA: bifunctional shikimate kinase/3-dehydroquinate synthase [Candidatus Dormibacteraeota bacterium]|nr:bifunctional shikimate kinase/3-dehydroquinate synthase [Candidatus Dormibacteraeota bacterium]